MSTPCNNTPIKFVNCCDVMNCVDIHSSDNSVTVVKDDACGINLTITSNNLDQILQINDGQCIVMLKEFIDGVLTITPILNKDCLIALLGEDICNLCTPPSCSPPIGLVIAIAS